MVKMKAIFVSQTSGSGDVHDYPIAAFTSDQEDLMNRMLDELNFKYTGVLAYFYIDEYCEIPINPKSIKEIMNEP
jgi:hypothetical protein